MDSVRKEITVVLVIAPDISAERLRELASRAPVWISRSEHNEQVTRQIRNRLPGASVTVFSPSPPGAPAEQELEIVPTIDEHSGEYGAAEHIDALDVVGLSLTEAAQRYLRTENFNTFQTTADGFTARRA